MTILSTMQLLMKQKLETQYLCSIIDDNYAWLGLLELLRYPVTLCLGVDTEFYCRIERCQVSLTNSILLASEYRTFSVFSPCATLSHCFWMWVETQALALETYQKNWFIEFVRRVDTTHNTSSQTTGARRVKQSLSQWYPPFQLAVVITLSNLTRIACQGARIRLDIHQNYLTPFFASDDSQSTVRLVGQLSFLSSCQLRYFDILLSWYN